MCELCEGKPASPEVQARADQGYSQGLDDVNQYLSLTFEWHKAADGSEEKNKFGWAISFFGKQIGSERLQILAMLLASRHVQLLEEHYGGIEGIENFLKENNERHAKALRELGDPDS